MHSSNAAALQERGTPLQGALGSCTHLHTASSGQRRKWNPTLYSCLLMFTAVSSAISTFMQGAEEIHFPLLKEFSSKLLLFWMAQASEGFRDLEVRENLLSTHCWHSLCSLPSPITTHPPQIICFPKHLAISRPCLDLSECLWHGYVTPPWCCPSACLMSDSWKNMDVYKSFKWCTQWRDTADSAHCVQSSLLKIAWTASLHLFQSREFMCSP